MSSKKKKMTQKSATFAAGQKAGKTWQSQISWG